MKTIRTLRACTTLAILTSCLLSLAADSPKPAPPETKPKLTAAAPDGSDPWKRRLTEFRADGLPLPEVANALSERFPEINFVLDPAVKDIVVELRLRSVTLEDIFTAIGITTQTTQTGGNGVIDPNTGQFMPLPPSPGAVQANKVSDRMVSFTARQAPASETSKPICRAFSLARYLAGKSEAEAGKALEEVEEVLGLCWKLLQDADRSSTKIATPRLSLHRATKLLVVVGQSEQIEVVEQVIGQLDGAQGVAGGPFIDPVTGMPAASGGGAPGAAPNEAMRILAARYGLQYGGTPSPALPSTNPPPQSK